MSEFTNDLTSVVLVDGLHVMNKPELNYNVIDEQGNSYYLGPDLFEAETMPCRCCNEDIDAYITDTWTGDGLENST